MLWKDKILYKVPEEKQFSSLNDGSSCADLF